MTDSSTFQDDWGFASEIKQSLGASGYDINLTPDSFSTGRARFEAVFYEGAGHNRRVIATRTAMELTSKRTGKPYHVVSRKPNREHAPRQAAARQPYTLEDTVA